MKVALFTGYSQKKIPGSNDTTLKYFPFQNYSTTGSGNTNG
jgi:hypothetical protein